MLKAILLVEDASRITSFHSLQQNCRTLHHCKKKSELAPLLNAVDAVVLHVPYGQMAIWTASVSSLRQLPILWFCTENDMPMDMDWGYALDGILYPSMTTTEVTYALKWGIRQHNRSLKWSEEREQLLQRLEERKWIDQAKAVLCEIKGISESEAYDFLRKQAMNERKRIGDVAASIVKVYQLIHG